MVVGRNIRRLPYRLRALAIAIRTAEEMEIMIFTAEQVRARIREIIAERYESQTQAAHVWGIPLQTLNDALQGRRAVPNVLLARFGFKRVIMYDDGKA